MGISARRTSSRRHGAALRTGVETGVNRAASSSARHAPHRSPAASPWSRRQPKIDPHLEFCLAACPAIGIPAGQTLSSISPGLRPRRGMAASRKLLPSATAAKAAAPIGDRTGLTLSRRFPAGEVSAKRSANCGDARWRQAIAPCRGFVGALVPSAPRCAGQIRVNRPRCGAGRLVSIAPMVSFQHPPRPPPAAEEGSSASGKSLITTRITPPEEAPTAMARVTSGAIGIRR